MIKAKVNKFEKGIYKTNIPEYESELEMVDNHPSYRKNTISNSESFQIKKVPPHVGCVLELHDEQLRLLIEFIESIETPKFSKKIRMFALTRQLVSLRSGLKRIVDSLSVREKEKHIPKDLSHIIAPDESIELDKSLLMETVSSLRARILSTIIFLRNVSDDEVKSQCNTVLKKIQSDWKLFSLRWKSTGILEKMSL